ncbi:Holliday junction branch migration protein RuvA [Pseudonocardia ailaonensis]|uniref:Holliday junction branch migration complex subunit RuvA n=1 Tax=Pseudonocardia ailaonensis TaxID=367279 RepID=A0ABN2MPQ4_9PSEU
MISSVRGPVLEIGLDHAVVEVGGVGFAVFCTPNTLAGLRRGNEARLSTTLIVREESLTLFGFADADERELFLLLQTVSGIGPRLALATIAVLEPDVLRRALHDGDLTTLMRIPGVGKKSAERLVVELRDKVLVGPATLPAAAGAPTAISGNARRDQVVEALVGLGFTQKPAEQAVDSVLAQDPAAEPSGLLRSALSSLGRSR